MYIYCTRRLDPGPRPDHGTINMVDEPLWPDMGPGNCTLVTGEAERLWIMWVVAF